MSGHAIDVPVTNLDENEDDFMSPVGDDEELDVAALRDDFDMAQPITFKKESLFTKVKQAFSHLTAGKYSKVPKSLHMNGIELREGIFNDNDSFELSDDEFILKRRADSIFANTLSLFKRYLTYTLVLLLVIAVIVLSVIVSKLSKNEKYKIHKEKLFNGTDTFYPTTILVSLDGFHPHYISANLTPALHGLLQKGYSSPYLIPSFPSSTFPNHWTIATGLYPESHGIVGNTFYDPKLGQFINVIPEKSLNPEFWGGEPIWSTAEKNGVRSAIHMFPGSEVKFDKYNPTEVDKYNGTETLQVKIDRIMGWLNRDISSRPELIISYVPTIDSLGHKYGIKGKKIEEGLKYVDNFIADLIDGLSQRNLTDIVNLFIVSDHGMAPTSEDRLIYLDDLLNTTKIQYIDGWPLFGLRPYEDYPISEVFQELRDSFKPNSGYSIYLKENIPTELKFAGKRHDPKYYDRIAPIWVIPDIGYSITTHDDMERKGGVYSPKGVHGYNNSEVLMRAIFLGDGPYFKSKTEDNDAPYKIKPFKNVEVYNILCDSLNLPAAPNNGSTNFVNFDNLLPKDWKDSFSYPGVDFNIDTLKIDSTYEQLFGFRQTTTLEDTKEPGTTPEAGFKSNIEATKSGLVEDFKSTVGPSLESEVSITTTKEDIPVNTDVATATTTTSTQKDKHKGIWGFIEDTAEDIGENLENLGEEIKEDLEDFFEDKKAAAKGGSQ